MTTDNAVIQSQMQELKRGSIVIAVLALLKTSQYGYALLEDLAAREFDVEANTLYPLLRRLEGQGLLTSEWNTDESRPRKYYQTSENGAELLDVLRTEWGLLNRRIEGLPTAGSER